MLNCYKKSTRYQILRQMICPAIKFSIIISFSSFLIPGLLNLFQTALKAMQSFQIFLKLCQVQPISVGLFDLFKLYVSSSFGNLFVEGLRKWVLAPCQTQKDHRTWLSFMNYEGFKYYFTAMRIAIIWYISKVLRKDNIKRQMKWLILEWGLQKIAPQSRICKGQSHP